jgi:RES domain-containing protein
MPFVYRVTKARYAVFDGAGADLEGARWNSPGRVMIYGADALAGCLLQILVHTGRRQRLPGAHHAARGWIPDDLPVEVLDEHAVPGWDEGDSAVARAFGDRWLVEARSAVLSVPSLVARPFGRNLLLNPLHANYPRIQLEPPVPIVWDARLFRV